jgi:hypothetical protein
MDLNTRFPRLKAMKKFVNIVELIYVKEKIDYSARHNGQALEQYIAESKETERRSTYPS